MTSIDTGVAHARGSLLIALFKPDYFTHRCPWSALHELIPAIYPNVANCPFRSSSLSWKQTAGFVANQETNLNGLAGEVYADIDHFESVRPNSDCIDGG